MARSSEAALSITKQAFAEHASVIFDHGRLTLAAQGFEAEKQRAALTDGPPQVQAL
jgi:hypothetical protein